MDEQQHSDNMPRAQLPPSLHEESVDAPVPEPGKHQRDSTAKEPEQQRSARDTDQPPPARIGFVLLVEGGVAVCGLVLGAFGFHASDQPIIELDPVRLRAAVLFGGLATIPLLFGLWVTLHMPGRTLGGLRRVSQEKLVPMFASCSFQQIAVIAILAGFAEELCFRWALQGGIATYLDLPGSEWIAAALAGLLFGLLHFINVPYFIATTVVGFYLGALMIATGTYLAPALTHALYDFFALLALRSLLPGASDQSASSS